MRLAEYRRPPNDLGRALAWPRAAWDGGPHGLEAWIRELGTLGITWVHVEDEDGNSIPLCERLLDHAIFPIVRIVRRDPRPNDGPEPNPGHINPREEETIRRLAASGVRYFETNSEPDLVCSWKNGAMPAPTDALDLVALNWLFDARVILEAGGYPGLPAISPGGQFDLLAVIGRLERTDLLNAGSWISVHNAGLNRPAEFPDDPAAQEGQPLSRDEYDQGPFTEWAWWNGESGTGDSLERVNWLRREYAYSGLTVEDDPACIREYERYYARALALLRTPLPILCTGGGYRVGQRDDLRYPRLTPDLHAARTSALFEGMLERAPEYLFCAMGGRLLTDGPAQGDDWYGDFWPRVFTDGYQGALALPPFPVPGFEGGELPVIAAVTNLPRAARPLPGAPAAPPPPPFALTLTPVPRSSEPPPPPSEKIYVVQQGESLIDVASRFGVTVSSLIAANEIKNPNASFAGRQLVVLLAPETRSHERDETHAAPVADSAPEQAQPTYTRLAGLEWDPRLDALRVRLERTQGKSEQWVWKLLRAEYLDPGESGSRHEVEFVLRDEAGVPCAGQVHLAGPDGEQRAETDEQGRAALELWAAYFPDHAERGAYRAWVGDLLSDAVNGLGLPNQNPVSYRLLFQRTRR